MRNLINYILSFALIVGFGNQPVFAHGLKEVDKQKISNDVQLLENGGFEYDLTGWTKTGTSTLVKQTVGPAIGKAHATWNPGATGEFLRSDLVAVPEGLKNRNCAMIFEYQWGSGVSGEIKANVSDGTTVLATLDLDPATDYRKSTPIMFTCPSSGSIRAELESTADAAAINVDGFELGKLRVIQVDTSAFVGGVYHPSNVTNCRPTISSNSGANVSFSTDVDCSVFSGIGSKTTVTGAAGVPAFTIADLPVGSYIGIVDVVGTSSTLTGGEFTCRLTMSVDGTVYGSDSLNTSQANNARYPDAYGNFEFNFDHAGGSANFELLASQTGGGSTYCQLNMTGTVPNVSSIRIYRMPTQPADAITLETTGEYWDVNIGGSNPSLGTSAVTSYTEIADAGLDMVLNAGSAQIPCDTTNTSTGLTCSVGNESLGIVFNTSTAGRYRTCVAFTHDSRADAAGFVRAAFQLVETPNNSQTIIQEGNTRISSSDDNTTATSHSGSNPVSFCSNFTFSSPGQKTIRLMYEQETAATISNNSIQADRSSTIGQRDIHITVEKIDQQMPTPVFTDLQNSLNKKIESPSTSSVPKQYSAIIECDATPTIISEVGSWIDSISFSSTGKCTVNLNASSCLSNIGNCQATAVGGIGAGGARVSNCSKLNDPIDSVAVIRETNGGVFEDGQSNITLICE